MPLTIRRSHRALLRRQLLTELSGIGDVYLAVEEDQWGAALTLRRRYEGCMRLLDDLGWREDDRAEEFAITMDPVPLMRVLARMHERASEKIEQQVEDLLVDGATVVDATLMLAICGEVLVALAGDGFHSATSACQGARDDGAERGLSWPGASSRPSMRCSAEPCARRVHGATSPRSGSGSRAVFIAITSARSSAGRSTRRSPSC
jgi:hypothetical protein